jgi:phosphoenolpyruvate synthase/pyruvate phosphate dikinase
VSLLDLRQVADMPAEAVGGKARGLGRLVAASLPVPDARVLDVAAHGRYLKGGELAAQDAEALAAVADELGAPLAVRSSAADEDSDDRSAAGQYESVMGVRGARALIDAVARCYAAADSERARSYRGDVPAHVAVVIQREIASGRAGVAFSVDPVSGRDDAVVIEAAFGHGEGIVAGAVNPDRYAVSREGRRVRARRADKAAMSDGDSLHDVPAPRRLARVLRDDEAVAIAELVIRAEGSFGGPVDVEFCFEGPRLWLVQCRPITTLHVAA